MDSSTSAVNMECRDPLMPMALWYAVTGSTRAGSTAKPHSSSTLVANASLGAMHHTERGATGWHMCAQYIFTIHTQAKHARLSGQ